MAAKSKAKYVRIKIDDKKKYDPRSFRTIPVGKEGKKLIIGCPKGAWSEKNNQCLVGTRAVSELIPVRSENMKKKAKIKRKVKRTNPCYIGRRRNIEMGFYDDSGIFHPIRASKDYDPERAGEYSEDVIGIAKPKKKSKAKAKTKAKARKKNIPLFLVNEPVEPVVEIYPKVEKIFATKTKGSAKGKYYHKFKKGVKAYGLSDGSVLLTTKKLLK